MASPSVQGESGKTPSPGRASAYWLLGAALVLLAGAAVVQLLLAPRILARAEAGWRAQLEAMSLDRARLVDRWLEEGLAQARVIGLYPTAQWEFGSRRGGSPPFPAELGAEGHLSELLTSSAEVHGLESAWVVGEDGRGVGSATSSRDAAIARQTALRVLAAGRPLVDFPEAAGRRPVVVFASPMTRVRAAVVLVASPQRWLYPLLRAELLRIESAECLLVQSRQGVVEFLSPLRRESTPEAGSTPPLVSPGPAAAAALGEEGFGTFEDYRGRQVFAATRRLTAADWGLVVKVDRQEALAGARRELRDLMLVVELSLAMLLALGMALDRRQRSRHALTLAQRDAQLGSLLEHANDAILLIDRAGRIRRAHGAAASLYGRSLAELQGLELADLLSPQASGTDRLADVDAALRAGQFVCEAEHLSADGEPIQVEVSARAVRLGDEELLLAIVRDVRLQRAEERRVRALNAALRTLGEVSRLVQHERDAERLLPEVCQVAVRDDVFATAWVGLLDSNGRLVLRCASGEGVDRLDAVVGQLGENSLWWRAIRGDTICSWPAGLADPPECSGWMREQHLRSAVAAPLRREGRVSGVIALYSRGLELGREIEPLVGELAVDLSLALETAEAQRHRDDAREALREARERYRMALLHSPVVVFEQDQELRYTWVHDPEHRLIGEAVGSTDAELLPASDAGRLSELKRSVLQTGDGIHELFETGAGGILDLTLEPLRRNGTVSGVIGTAVDVTASRERETRLRQLSRAIEQSPSAVIITDTRGSIEYVNSTFTSVSGYTPAEVAGKTMRLVKSGEHPEETYAELWRTITSGHEWRGELCNRRKTGELYWESVSIAPLADETGRVTHFVSVQHDLSERRTAERELEEARLQLVQSQKLEAVGRLAGGVAHDFNNLLNVIMGFTELLGRGLGDDERARQRVDQIMRAARRAGDLTRQLLAFSRRQVLQPEVVDLDEAVGEFEKMLRRLIGEDVDLAFRPAATGKPLVKVDPGQMEQVLMNLCINARDAMPQGGLLRIETEVVTLDASYAVLRGPVEPGEYVRLTVSDSGSGMDAATQARIFEPFFTTKEAGTGTGLGLATVYGIVKQSGGYIWVYSEAGVGTTFKIYLPLTRDESEPRAPDADPPVRASGGGVSILLVEDQEALREMIHELLVDLGYEVEAAADGDAALEWAASREVPVDLLLTDLVMPRMSGRELAEQLRQRWPGLRVLYMSGYTADVVARHGILEPGVPLLHKPFSTAELARRVQEALEAAPRQ